MQQDTVDLKSVRQKVSVDETEDPLDGLTWSSVEQKLHPALSTFTEWTSIIVQNCLSFCGIKNAAIYSVNFPPHLLGMFPHILDQCTSFAIMSRVVRPSSPKRGGILVVEVIEGIYLVDYSDNNDCTSNFMAISDYSRLVEALKIIRSRIEEYRSSVRVMTVDDVILQSTLKQDIVEDVEIFLSSKDLYQELGIPWKRSMLLWGPPGNGKTMLIRTIARKYNLHTVDLRASLENRCPPCAQDSGRQVFWNIEQFWSPDLPVLYHLEDIDKFIPSYRTTDYATVTLATLLNVLDGVDLLSGCYIIATANELTGIVQSLKDRPGRIDTVYEIPLPTRDQIHEFFTRKSFQVLDNTGTNITLSISAKLAEAELSMAYANELYIATVSRYSQTTVAISQVEPILSKLLSHHNLSQSPKGQYL